MRRACDQCHGTDTQRECEQGWCYAEEQERQEEERARQEEEDRARAEAEDEEAYEMGVRAALDGMDLPDGAYFGMADELGIEP